MNESIIKDKEKIESDKLLLDKKFSHIATVRLVVFLAAIVLISVGISKKSLLIVGTGALLIAVFIYLVRYHSIIRDKMNALSAKGQVVNRYIMRYSGKWKDFKDNGSEFLTQEDTVSYDLDLLGKNSLYQMITIAHTSAGRKKLAETLSLKTDHLNEMDKRYEAITELGKKTSFLVDFEASSERILEKREKALQRRLDFDDEDEDNDSDDETKSGKEAAGEEKNSFPVWMYPLMVLVPAMNIFTVVMVLSGAWGPSKILMAFIAGMIITWMPLGLHQKLKAPIESYGSAANDYYKMLGLIKDETFDSALLSGLREKVVDRDGSLGAIKKMDRITSLSNISYNPIVHMALAGFLGWDFFISKVASSWISKYSGVFEESTDILSDFEELGSLAVLSMVRETKKPVITKELRLDLEQVYHPLLNPDTVVSNDGQLTNSLTIITGSNMSGKTTFLRTVAINLVLAYTGSGVCAKNFKVPFVKLFTSMRVMDDVAGGISTFYAEILRIKEMAEYVTGGNDVPALCLIDEIFKGTNSADRIVGAEQALKKLSAGNAMVIVSTHDFELCELTTEDGSAADNYHFEEYYENDQLRFDYKIKDGRCTTRNAMAILKMAGLVQN